MEVDDLIISSTASLRRRSKQGEDDVTLKREAG